MCDRITQRGVDPEALSVFPFTGSDPPRGSMKSASGKMLSEMPSKEKPGIPMAWQGDDSRTKTWPNHSPNNPNNPSKLREQSRDQV